ncbi:unnamed protein product [Camellia sinensis]
MASPPEDSLLEKVENFITEHVTDRKRKKRGEPESEEPAHLLELLHRQLINPEAFGVVSENKGGGGSSCCYSYQLIQNLVARSGSGKTWPFRGIRDEDLGLRREGRRLGLRRGSQTARSKSSNRGSKPAIRYSPCSLNSAPFSHQIRVSLSSDSRFCCDSSSEAQNRAFSSESSPFETIPATKIQKLIDLVSRNKEGNSWYSYRSAQELKAAGIQFRPNKESNFFTDARYEPQFIRAILRLPPMTIDDSTKALLLNLVAYEMCTDSPNDFGVTSYLWFMDTLIDQAEDVKELRKKSIILNFLGSDQHVAELFNEIAKNLVPNPNAYEDVKNRIERHYKNKVRLWVTERLYDHFSSPWTLLAFLGALLAIALSFVQAYYAVNPKK